MKKSYKFTLLSEFKINPRHEQMKKHANIWLTKFNLFDLSDEKIVEKLEKSRFYDLVALCYPTADKYQLNVINSYIFWTFILDDVFRKKWFLN
jgi:hypothetical protein